MRSTGQQILASAPSRQARTARRPVTISYLLAVAAYATLFSVWRVEPVPWNVHLASILVAATSFLPLARWYARGGQGLPMFELICLSYALQFSVPVYTQANQVVIMSRALPLRWTTTFEVLVYVELGIVAMMAGYYLGRKGPLSQNLPRLDLPLIPERRRLYLLGALLGSGFLTVLSVLDWEPLSNPAFGAILRLVSSQFNIAIVLLAYSLYAETRSRVVYVGLYVAVAYAFLVGLTTGMLENALMPLVLVLAVRWHVTRRLPWLAILAGFVLFGLLNPAKFEYRRQVWYSGQEYGFNERLSVWGEALEGELQGRVRQSAWEETIRGTLERFDLVHKFTYVREMTPAFIPYYGGETYSYFLYAWIPRLLWPDKPSASAANEKIDIDYAFKYDWQDSTISIGQLPEAYANFGIVGIVVVMALQGLVFTLLDTALNGPRSEGGRAIYLVVMATFLNGIGTSAAVLFGALAQYILASAVIMRPFATGWQASDGHHEKQTQVPELLSTGSAGAAQLHDRST